MKIIDSRADRSCILSLLFKGDPFVVPKRDGFALYLCTGERDNDKIKVVNLKNGDIDLIENNTLVEPVDLTIEVYSRSIE